jgi:hypothetical protein
VFLTPSHKQTNKQTNNYLQLFTIVLREVMGRNWVHLFDEWVYRLYWAVASGSDDGWRARPIDANAP